MTPSTLLDMLILSSSVQEHPNASKSALLARTNQLCFSSTKRILYLGVVLLLAGCGSQSVKNSKALEGVQPLADLHVVDCLLPGQVRKLGNSSYLTQRRPTETTAADCRIRGGEYTSYDRADYKSALRVWMPAAKSGDAEAMANVGEIFERGLGGTPNYQAAVIWYQKAADLGNARAQFNLGTLYEQGKGVQKDQAVALNLYRAAWGIPEDSLIYESAAEQMAEARAAEVRDELNARLKSKETQLSLLNQQLAGLQDRKEQLSRALADARAANSQQGLAIKEREASELDSNKRELERLVAQLQNERLVAMNEIDALPRYRKPNAAPTLRMQTGARTQSLELDDMKFGDYHALIIANQNYDTIDNLLTPHPDALRAKKLLEEKFGFSVTVLFDADNAALMRAINSLNDKLSAESNLLIFYAGHGERIQSGSYEAGYWLPVNASAPPDDTFWVSNEFVTRHLSRLKAKRIMVVADSCYAGLLSTAPGYLTAGQNADYTKDYIRYKLPKRSRLLLSSGGDKPVLDNAGNGNSIFAKAFLDALDGVDEIISGPELFSIVRAKVSERAEDIGFAQVPEFKAIKGAGHEVGDFFFVTQQ